MATKQQYLTLGPAALEVLALERRLKARERYEQAKQEREQTSADLSDLMYEDEDFTQFLQQQAMQEITDANKEEETGRSTYEIVQNVYDTLMQFLYDYTPVDTGNLLDALYSENNGTSFKVGFDMHKAPYAVYQHENTTLHHSNGTAKFLQKALCEALSLCDSYNELTANMDIRGLTRSISFGPHLSTGPILEVQVNYPGLTNVSDTLMLSGEYMTANDEDTDVDFNFNHDYVADMDALTSANSLFSQDFLNSIDISVVAEMVTNRRFNSKKLGALAQTQIVDMAKEAYTAGDREKMSAAYGVYLLKNRINYRKAFAKFAYMQERIK